MTKSGIRRAKLAWVRSQKAMNKNGIRCDKITLTPLLRPSKVHNNNTFRQSCLQSSWNNLMRLDFDLQSTWINIRKQKVLNLPKKRSVEIANIWPHHSANAWRNHRNIKAQCIRLRKERHKLLKINKDQAAVWFFDRILSALLEAHSILECLNYLIIISHISLLI